MSLIVVADPLQASGVAILRGSGAEVREVAADERPRLPELLAEADALVVRSMTKVTAELLRAGRRLKVVGRAGVGVDNVDVEAATAMGVLVVNAPTANLLSATEHTFALLLALARNVPAADASLKGGAWERGRFQGTELQGKRLGIVGFGRIGQQVAERARAFGMEVAAYDPFLDPAVATRQRVELLPLDELLARADVVTLHTPLTDQTRNLLDSGHLQAMKRGALLVNCARGGLVDEAALLELLDAGHLGGAALDVFAEEPPRDLALIRHPKVVATPHLGAQTLEAQERIATETAEMVLKALAGSLAVAAVNLPFRPAGAEGEPYLALGERLGSLAAQLLAAAPSRLRVDTWGVEEELRAPVAVAALKGTLARQLGETVNYVNAAALAESRALELVHAAHSLAGDYPHLVRVRLDGRSGERVELEGALFGRGDPRVVRFGGYRLEFRPEGRLLVLENRDVPGVVGNLGTILGAAGINIADIHLARRDHHGEALAVLRIDQEPPAELLRRIGEMPEVRSVRLVHLPPLPELATPRGEGGDE
ncbi:MAG TPA: phosphoglycerate dehydrogenase [Thermoanaerobaculia bacterium]|nr:phosphoglycerate dehydrogenase [Thermoanaerobaculia bacterium]